MTQAIAGLRCAPKGNQHARRRQMASMKIVHFVDHDRIQKKFFLKHTGKGRWEWYSQLNQPSGIWGNTEDDAVDKGRGTWSGFDGFAIEEQKKGPSKPRVLVCTALFGLALAGAWALAIRHRAEVQTAEFATPVDNASWLPETSRYDEEAAHIPEGARLTTMIPEDEPISEQASNMRLGSSFEMYPDDKTSIVIKGGALVSKVGDIEKRALFRSWDYLYEDAKFTKPLKKWGPSLTSGQLLVERDSFKSSFEGVYAQNSFIAEPFGKRFVLVTLDPAKGHRLCYLRTREGNVFTGGLAGTRAEVGGMIIEKGAKGWHLAEAETSK